MALSNALVGRRSAPLSFRFDFKDVILYALGVGAKQDELDFLYEGKGPRVLPTFAVVPCFPAMVALAGNLGENPMMILHGEQEVVLHRPIPPHGTFTTVSEIKHVWDKGKGAVVAVEARTVDEKGETVFDNHFSVFVRGGGGFGGERGPETPRQELPTRAPDFEIAETTSPEQALLYRLSGDLNPLHADPAMSALGGFDKPILHGLCTYGYAGRAILRGACGGDEKRLQRFSARFTGTVLPGDTLTTRGWRQEGGRWAISVSTSDGRQVLGNASAQIL